MSGYSPRVIKRTLATKVEEWIQSITDQVVKQAAERDTIVTGGSIASMVLGEPINDYDIYFKTTETAQLVAEYYREKAIAKGMLEEDILTITPSPSEKRVYMAFKNKEGRVADETNKLTSEDNALADSELEENEVEQGPKYDVKFISENAITLSNKIQLITRFCGEPEEIHNNYDFIHAMNYYEHKDQNLVLKAKALEALMCKRLYYVGSLYPVCSLFRMRKFIDRGWKISAGEILKIAFQISSLDLSDIKVLREQLVGVDMLYFHQLINAIELSPQGSIEQSYIVEIINRIFNQ